LIGQRASSSRLAERARGDVLSWEGEGPHDFRERRTLRSRVGRGEGVPQDPEHAKRCKEGIMEAMMANGPAPGCP